MFPVLTMSNAACEDYFGPIPDSDICGDGRLKRGVSASTS